MATTASLQAEIQLLQLQLQEINSRWMDMESDINVFWLLFGGVLVRVPSQNKQLSYACLVYLAMLRCS